MVTACSPFGATPNDAALEKMASSPQFNLLTQQFENMSPNVVKEMNERSFSFAMLKEWLFSVRESKPSQKLPEVKPDMDEFMRPSENIKVIWLGHSTLLVNFSGKLILIDPVFSKAASPVSFFIKRFQPTAISLNELPPVDFIVISHDHYDHLDMQTVKFFKNKKAAFLVPLGVGSHLKRWGIAENRITEMDWWQRVIDKGISFTATPAQHFSGRGLSQNKTLWSSWVISDTNHSIFYSGDSGYDSHFKEIGERLGPFELAFIETGQYNEYWKEVHMLPDESAQAFYDLKAEAFFPIHWGMFTLAMHDWDEPVKKAASAAASKGFKLFAPRLGEPVSIAPSAVTQHWWKEPSESLVAEPTLSTP